MPGKPATTRTLNPLPFQDLEPHRFEDLVRQLAYDLRRWKSLEPLGRSGSDEGLDIRAIELVRVQEDLDDDDEELGPSFEERLWIFQCKREKTLAPKYLRKVIQESFASLEAPPHGFILAIACDVSKKSRDAFREEMVSRGVQEFAIWAKGELEDMLFQAKNDRLLFAYFGISLQPRRQSLATTLRSQIAKKKQLAALIGEDDNEPGHSAQETLILIRDPSDLRYPNMPDPAEASPKWIVCHALTLKHGPLIVRARKYFATIADNATRWDAILEHDVARADAESELRFLDAWSVDRHPGQDHRARQFWSEYIEEPDRAYLVVYGAIDLDRIAAIDRLGDGYYPIPHLFVEFDEVSGPFRRGETPRLERVAPHQARSIEIDPDESNRTQIFPKPLPSVLDVPPDRFDDTLPAPPALSEGAATELKSILEDVGQAETPHGPEPTPKPSPPTKQAFREWCDAVALPVLSSFVHPLRAAQHAARVVVHPGRSSDSGVGSGYQAIELRVRLRLPSIGGGTYTVGGKLHCFESSGRLIADPSTEHSGRRDLEQTSITKKEDLEAAAVGLIRHLSSREH